MLDVVELKKRTDLLALVSEYTPLKRKASTRGGEWAGPCPWCGGDDRFIVWPNASEPGYFCRGCGKSGDAISFVRDKEGLEFRAACERLGASPANFAPLPRAVSALPLLPPLWSDTGLEVMAECVAALWTDKGLRAREWLNRRGLRDGTLQEWHIGYNPEEGNRHGLQLSRGIVIPLLAVDGRLWGINIRRPVEGKDKYRAVAGSKKTAMLGRLTGKTDVLMCEGEFDCMLAWQECGDLVDVATFGSNCVQPADHWLPFLQPYQHFLLAYDTDGAGNEGAALWEWTSRAVRLVLPLSEGEGKDICDFWKAGGDLHAWLKMALSTVEPTAPVDAEDKLLALVGALQDAEARGDTAEATRLLEQAKPLGGMVWRQYQGTPPPSCLMAESEPM